VMHMLKRANSCVARCSQLPAKSVSRIPSEKCQNWH